MMVCKTSMVQWNNGSIEHKYICTVKVWLHTEDDDQKNFIICLVRVIANGEHVTFNPLAN
jgi:hypothetical protein